MRKYIDFEERIENIFNDIRVEIIELIESTGKKEYTFKKDYVRLTLTDEFDSETIVVSKIKWDDESGELFIVSGVREYVISDFVDETLTLSYLYDELYNEINRK